MRCRWIPLALAGALVPGSAAAQGLPGLAESCAGVNVALTAWCQELALAGAAIQRTTGLAASLGSDIPGTASTLGLRMGSAPRVGLSLTPLWVRVAIPDIGRGDGVAPTPERSGSVTGIRAAAAVGILDGFQLAPTVGGVLSVDALASVSLARLPKGLGFAENATGLGLGARVGVFRESFTLPGVSVSVMRHWPGGAVLGSIAQGGNGEVDADAAVTSLRATVGKNLFAVGLLAGVGWERYSGDVRVLASVADGLGGTLVGSATGEIETDRRLYFVAGWFNFLISQISLEAGLAEGFDDPMPARLGAYAPHDRTFFLSLGLRITI